jgi:hypothetical protein
LREREKEDFFGVDVWWRERGEAMEMWKSDIGGEFTESRNNGEGCERALSFSITYKGCYNCKIDCSNLLFHKISCYR